jgi:uncharacterized protein YndB with AHSA1/START domain
MVEKENKTRVEPIRKSIRVDRSPADAFRIFTSGIGEWWPVKTHSVGRDEAVGCAMETRAGGRLYERAADGTEQDWGRILDWDPPRRLKFSWHPGRGAETAQEVTVTFSPDGEGTRVELLHDGWEKLGKDIETTRDGYDSGWDMVFGDRFATACR